MIISDNSSFQLRSYQWTNHEKCSLVGGLNVNHPSYHQTGQFSTIINLDEDRPRKISILMAPNYPEQRPTTARAPVSFKKLKQNKSKRILRLQHADCVIVTVFVLINDAYNKMWPRSLRVSVAQPPRLA